MNETKPAEISSPKTTVVFVCDDLDASIAEHVRLGYRLDMIMPADAPRIALLSRNGHCIRLERRDAMATPPPAPASTPSLHVERASAQWQVGRAGMQYRDLIPDRLGGRFIASHIRIPDGGQVPDYVHYHKVGFQMIYCRRGWVRVVYEDQGGPFVMHAGDCVLQPPTIRHRVLEASSGLEVIEVGAPAEHETWREHAFDLPTTTDRPDRLFGGQRFVRDIAEQAHWSAIDGSGFTQRETAIAAATNGLAQVRVLRERADGADSKVGEPLQVQDDGLLLLFVLAGRLRIQTAGGQSLRLGEDDACTISAGIGYRLLPDARPGPINPEQVRCEVLQVNVAELD
ncbi:MAG: cupin domain-containing protein [Lysobacteraceae bacterium]